MTNNHEAIPVCLHCAAGIAVLIGMAGLRHFVGSAQVTFAGCLRVAAPRAGAQFLSGARDRALAFMLAAA